ncbi:hypothetical protein PIROE2DRAFT_5792 [Piromyces sp. E2]|nr:hypothetical protein PIROE2DRAFT_5792 [Piromyces sp. E2]|eukprot:OUM66932.1 hypothetical protein PIROE2DRAFT_5792 [Piromyces sp. E2]
MRKFIYFFCVFIIAGFINTAQSRYIKRDSEDNLDFVNEETTESVDTIDKHIPTQEEFINNLINQIDKLIRDNIDTYDHPEILEKILNNSKKSKKKMNILKKLKKIIK